MRIETDIKLDFNDVLLKPKRSTLESRSQVRLERKFTFKNSNRQWEGIPIIASNMDATGTVETYKVLNRYKILTFLHKHYNIDTLYDLFASEKRENLAYSMGITDLDTQKWKMLKSKLPKDTIKFVNIDVANGYTERFINFIKSFREENPNTIIVAGNVCTADQTQELILSGADIIKIGIGPGSVCTTRIQTGVGFPQLSAVIECSDAANGLGGHVISDGGCTSPGDVAKAFGAGAHFTMLGGMLAGHEESGGDLVNRDGEMVKQFYGMSSEVAQNKYDGGLSKYKSAEGKVVTMPFKGPLEPTVQSILGGLRSACTYVGAAKIRELSKCSTFILVNNTHNKVYE
jgi:GMP reductase